MTNTNTTKSRLSPAQALMLARLARADELTPGGYSTAGRDASRWNRTLDVLVRRGLATRSSNGYSHRAAITAAGRAELGHAGAVEPESLKEI